MGRKQVVWENIATKLNDLLKTESLPKKAQMPSPRKTLHSPPPLKGLKIDTKEKNECYCYSVFQLHATAEV